jgi:hypothetical protein
MNIFLSKSRTTRQIGTFTSALRELYLEELLWRNSWKLIQWINSDTWANVSPIHVTLGKWCNTSNPTTFLFSSLLFSPTWCTMPIRNTLYTLGKSQCYFYTALIYAAAEKIFQVVLSENADSSQTDLVSLRGSQVSGKGGRRNGIKITYVDPESIMTTVIISHYKKAYNNNLVMVYYFYYLLNILLTKFFTCL